MLSNLDSYEIVLASSSPRRKELLQRLGLNFKVRTLLGIDESYPEDLKGSDIALHIAQNKAKGYLSSMKDNELIITADTIVYYNDRVFGKPKTVEHAKEMLVQLSGKTHEVFTGVCVFSKSKQEHFVATSKVTFAPLTEEEINYYIDQYLPIDKAGAYGIQDWIGLIAVTSLEGNYYNVMGLPMQELYECLKQF